MCSLYFCHTLWPWNKLKPQGHQTCNQTVDPEQDYNHAEFEKAHLNGVPAKANDKVLVKSENM